MSPRPPYQSHFFSAPRGEEDKPHLPTPLHGTLHMALGSPCPVSVRSSQATQSGNPVRSSQVQSGCLTGGDSDRLASQVTGILCYIGWDTFTGGQEGGLTDGVNLLSYSSQVQSGPVRSSQVQSNQSGDTCLFSL
jgi:hypothetical protein